MMGKKSKKENPSVGVEDKKEEKKKKQKKEHENVAKVATKTPLQTEIDVCGGSVNEANTSKRVKEKKKKSKDEKEKNDKKPTRSESVTSEKSEDAGVEDPKVGLPKDKTSRDKKLSTEEKRKRKAALLEQVPKIDENGMAYTKIQIRRMVKRVKMGLAPVLSEEEEQKLEKERRRAKKEDEKEFKEFMYDPEKDKNGVKKEDSGGEDEVEEMEDDYEPMFKGDDNVDIDDEAVEDDGAYVDAMEQTIPETQPATKKARRSKPLPPDYICQACKNDPECGPPHWIYDCPLKVTVRGTNQVAKPLRGVNEPDAKRKLFVSGLPFGVTHKAVEEFFRERCCKTSNAAGESKGVDNDQQEAKTKLVTCKLIRFGDSGKCRGQAYVTFANEEMTDEALKLDGVDWPSTDNGEDSGTEQNAKTRVHQRRWLSVTRIKSKIETKKIQRQRKWRDSTKHGAAKKYL